MLSKAGAHTLFLRDGDWQPGCYTIALPPSIALEVSSWWVAGAGRALHQARGHVQVGQVHVVLVHQVLADQVRPATLVRRIAQDLQSTQIGKVTHSDRLCFASLLITVFQCIRERFEGP